MTGFIIELVKYGFILLLVVAILYYATARIMRALVKAGILKSRKWKIGDWKMRY